MCPSSGNETGEAALNPSRNSWRQEEPAARAQPLAGVAPELCLPLLPSPLLPAWVLSVSFYVLVHCFFSCSASGVPPLWLSKGTPAPARPGRRKAQVGSSLGLHCLLLHLASVVSQ